MATKHWSWEHFTTDHQLFQNNNSYKNAWCIACVNNHREQLWQADVVNTAVSGANSGNTIVDWEEQGIVPGLFPCQFLITDRT
jgi:hypothetical protein